MAERLLRANHEVRLFNRTAARAEPLLARGARLFDTPREACQGVEAVVCMLADDVASRALWLGPQGILQSSAVPGAAMIECSTLSHEWVMQLSAAAQARGFRYIDAPVTGLPDAAAAGTLTLLVGAAPADLASARALLEVFSNRIVHFGPAGAGTAYKLLVNMLGAVQIASVAEMLAAAERAGLDLQLVADALGTGQAASPQVVRNAQRIAAAAHDEVIFTPQLRLKDVEYALRLTHRLGLGAPFGALAARLFRELCARGFSHVNESRIIDIARLQPPPS